MIKPNVILNLFQDLLPAGRQVLDSGRSRITFAYAQCKQSGMTNAGFTIVEMLMVIGILGVLGAVILATLNPVSQIEKGRDAKRKADLASLQRALETYYQDNGRYPAHSTASPVYRIVRANGTTAEWGQTFSPYMTVLPKDPGSSQYYAYVSTGQAYYLYASLERGAKDPHVCNNGNACTTVPAGVYCGASNKACNYGVSSSNTTP